MTIRPSLSLSSFRSAERQRMAMTSEAAVMSNPVSRAIPRSGPPMPSTTSRRTRSFMSSTRFQAIVRRSIRPQTPSKCSRLSTMAASRLWAEVTACRSPVKCRLMSSLGTTRACPPPVAPPFIPKTGPREGSRRAAMARWPRRPKASASPMAVVVFPSPAGVGVMAVTMISLPLTGRSLTGCGQRTLAL